MADGDLDVDSLRQAIDEIVRAPTLRRDVTVTAVHVAEAGALFSVLRRQEHWNVCNIGRLEKLVSIEALLRAIATDLFPILLNDPCSLAPLGLLARYVMASASTVGSGFAYSATTICEDLVAHAATGSQRPLNVTAPQMIGRTEELLRRIHVFRSSQLCIGLTDIDIEQSDSDTDTDTESDTITSLRQAIQEVVDAPAAHRRVTVQAIHVSHASALLAVLRFQASACSWELLVSNLMQ